MANLPREGHELYVYYRAHPERTEALAAAVQGMQQKLCDAHPGLAARLLCRAELRDGLHTWMEAYVLPPGRSAVALAAAIEQAAVVLAPLLDGPRRSEHFVACVW